VDIVWDLIMRIEKEKNIERAAGFPTCVARNTNALLIISFNKHLFTTGEMASF